MGSLRRTLIIATADARLLWNDWSARLWAFVIPVVFAVFMGLVTGGIGGPEDPVDPKARLSIEDHDGGFLAAALVEELESARLDVVRLEAGGEEPPGGRVRTLVIPEGFSESVRRAEPVTLQLLLEPGTSPEAALVAEARLLGAITSLIGRLVGVARREGRPIEEGAFEAAERPVPILSVESSFAGGARVAPTGFTQSVPGNIVMFVVLVSVLYGAASLAAERRQGTLRRLAGAPIRPFEIVLGKVAGRALVAQVQVFVLMGLALAGVVFADLYLGESLFALWVVFAVYALAVAPWGVLLGTFFTDPDKAAGVGLVITLVMVAFGGCWWPLEVVSPPLQALALVFPTGWAMQTVGQVMLFGRGLMDGAVLVGLGVLRGYALVGLLLVVRLPRTVPH